MAKPTSVTPVTKEPLVMVQFSYWAKFIMPASVAAELVGHLSNPAVVKVEESDGMYLPVKSDWEITPYSKPFISDLPSHDGSDEARKGFIDWIKTKKELVGKSYIPETYADYLMAQETS
jgi:hypothetical protein